MKSISIKKLKKKYLVTRGENIIKTQKWKQERM